MEQAAKVANDPTEYAAPDRNGASLSHDRASWLWSHDHGAAASSVWDYIGRRVSANLSLAKHAGEVRSPFELMELYGRHLQGAVDDYQHYLKDVARPVGIPDVGVTSHGDKASHDPHR